MLIGACGGGPLHPDGGGGDTAPPDCTQPTTRCVGVGQRYTVIQDAANDAQAGDTVVVFAGNYDGFVSVNSGTPQSLIVFEANGPDVVITTPTNRGDGINIEGTDYVRVAGFHVQGASRAGIRVAVSRGVVVRRNTVDGTGTVFGIFTGFAQDVIIEDNVAFNASGQHGIYVSNSMVDADNPVIRRNELYRNKQNGIQLNGDCMSGGDGILSGALIEGNLVHDNGGKGLSLISMQTSIVQNNVIWNNGTVGGAGGIHLTDEIPCGLPSNDNLIVANTIDESRIAAIRITDGATRNIVFDNIAIGSSGGIADEVGTSSIDLASNVTHGDPVSLFVTGTDLHEATGSPSIDQGVASYQGRMAPAKDIDGAARPQGGTFDVGAYER